MLYVAAYLNGGTNFGAVGTPTGPLNYAGPDIISRNLTPNYAQLAIINPPDVTPAELPNCIPTGEIVVPGLTPYNNIPDGNLLQVMPWVTFSHMIAYELDAIYEYLSAIPCIDNTVNTPPAGAPDELLNNCGAQWNAAVNASGDQKISRKAVRAPLR